MKYQLVFSPSLGLSPQDIAHAWNEDSEAQAIAHVRLEPASQKAYNDPLLDIAWLVVGNVGFGIATNALYDLLKKVIAKKEPKKHIKITKLDQPDGTHLLIFEQDEETKA
ncbi:hypothetical protein KSD_17240 [Ktedonobacter sp. SOSP1-85]|uniref:hypothetical protein n=1 Tax=Ktedonobacter sp. SOSP1-85 TaxID=2778367 RepID=UPI0019166F6E|nr:hypothetical protein [Ktedonobacter sp. SOSP1-85]GHO73953.1 hypothetical protein KSD_17240 [Ktedonobacter sp. SOSP1-85]